MPQLDLVVPGDLETPTGGYVYDRRIVAGLAARGWRTRTHALDPSFPSPTADAVDAARAVLAAIPDGRAVVIDGLALGGLAPVLADEARRLRLIALIHHPLADETGLPVGTRDALLHAERDALAQVARIVVTSRWTARRLTELWAPSAPIAVVEPGTDPAPSAGSCRAAFAEPPSGTPPTPPGSDRDGGREAAGGGHRPVRLLCVATLTPRKGHALLLDAVARLPAGSWTLDCVGSDDRDPQCVLDVRRRIERLGLGDRVVLHGELPARALETRYRDADVFVLASQLEGYGMALAEALARGLPIVSTTAGAIPDTVPADAGLLVPPGDAAALAEALGAVVGDADLRRRLAAGADAARRTLPDWTAASARFAAAVEDLAGGASA